MSIYFEHIGQLEDQEIVLLRDERTRVRDATKPPFRWICSLEVEFPEPVLYPLGTLEHPGKNWKNLTPTIKGCGSGLLITPTHVLTASHVIAGLKVVKDARSGKPRFRIVKANKVTIIPGHDAEVKSKPRPFGTFYSQSVLISPGFRTAMEVPVEALTKAQVRKSLASDYGIVEIKEQPEQISPNALVPGQTAGWWRDSPGYKLQAVEGDIRRQLQKARIQIGGYPGEKARIPCTVPWHSFDKVIDAFPKARGQTENLLLYQADTSAGMSGSPVWLKAKDGQFYLVAVHSSFLDYKANKKVNVGALITRDVVRQLGIWGLGYWEVLFSH